MLFDILDQNELFTNSEKAIVEYIKDKPYALNEMTAEDLGIVTNTSKSTVFRFLKKVNIKSFDKFKTIVKEEYKQKKRLEEFRLQEPFDQSSTVKDVIGKLPFFYDLAVINTNRMIDRGMVSRIVRHLREANIVDLYGTGITLTCANAAAFKFQSIGKYCNVFSNFNEHYTVSTINDKKVSILLSFTGGNSTIVRCARDLKKMGCYIVGIGGVVSSELKENCDDFLEIYQKELVSSFEFMTPYISLTYILDVIFASLLVKDFDNHFENSAKVRNLF